MMRLTWTALLTAGMCSSAVAQDGGDASRGDASRGLAFARTTCSGCHALEGLTSPQEGGPPFKTIANTPGMTALALKVWFQTPHPSMPNLMLDRQDRDDVIAYITSLKTNGG